MLRPEGYTERAIFIIDDDGIIRYIDIHDISEQPDNQVLFAEIKKLRPDYHEVETAADTSQLPHGGIVMYCTKWCPECRQARTWFNEMEIPYTEVDVMSVPGADKQVRAWNNGNLTTPTFDINGRILTGFNRERVTQLLKS